MAQQRSVMIRYDRLWLGVDEHSEGIELKCIAGQRQRKDRSCIDGKGIEMICNGIALIRNDQCFIYTEKEFVTWKRYT